MRSRIQRLSLTNFRSYAAVTLEAGAQTSFLFGPNGAGKTNLLEAISFFSPGRGFRGASLTEVGRRAPGEDQGRPWAVAAEVDSDDVVLSIGTGTEIPDAPRRLARVAGEGVPISALAEHVRPLWLTPAHDRLFADGAGDRRRFLDRLVFSWAPGHAADVSAYERSLRERMRVLGADSTDRAWLDALEAQAAKTGVRIASARAQTVLALNIEIDARDGRPFPAARIDLTGEWDRLAMDGVPANEIEAQLVRELAGARGRDGAAGRALCGPHRTDLSVVERNTGRAAAQCSTGEQKALILNLILAQAARLSRAIHVPNPILLLDEVAAHLDAERRAALFDEIDALSLQAFLTGTDEALFEAIKGRALGVRVEASSLTVAER